MKHLYGQSEQDEAASAASKNKNEPSTQCHKAPDKDRCEACPANVGCKPWKDMVPHQKVFKIKIEDVGSGETLAVLPFVPSGADVRYSTYDEDGKCVATKTMPCPIDGAQYNGDKQKT